MWPWRRSILLYYILPDANGSSHPFLCEEVGLFFKIIIPLTFLDSTDSLAIFWNASNSFFHNVTRTCLTFQNFIYCDIEFIANDQCLLGQLSSLVLRRARNPFFIFSIKHRVSSTTYAVVSILHQEAQGLSTPPDSNYL
jgi:hypothetical protein